MYAYVARLTAHTHMYTYNKHILHSHMHTHTHTHTHTQSQRERDRERHYMRRARVCTHMNRQIIMALKHARTERLTEREKDYTHAPARMYAYEQTHMALTETRTHP